MKPEISIYTLLSICVTGNKLRVVIYFKSRVYVGEKRNYSIQWKPKEEQQSYKKHMVTVREDGIWGKTVNTKLGHVPIQSMWTFALRESLAERDRN